MPADRMPRSAVRVFLDGEAMGGVLLILFAAIALALANGPLAQDFARILAMPLGPPMAGHGPLTVRLWINDGLMAFFFLLVGLEIKRELVDGRLGTREGRRLPVIAAACGMAVPALVYLAVTAGDATLVRGWAIPAATDIAFALAVLALLGARVPTSLKLFLTTVAIADDLGAVLIIAFAYTASLDLSALVASVALFLLLWLLGRWGVASLWIYLTIGAALWYAVLASGIHATVAGVLTAAAVPIIAPPGFGDSTRSPLRRLEHKLAPFVAFVVLPLFGLANAGVPLSGSDQILARLPIAVAAGLLIGKQLGIFGSIWLSVRLGIARRPCDATWLQLYGLSLLCGIGFTMSLFIGALAFPAPALLEQAKTGILLGSLASAVAGFAVLRLAPLHPQQDSEMARHGDVES